ncbi:MAG: hypothetical protein ACKO2P_09935 [Planctomycetota bacterium]
MNLNSQSLPADFVDITGCVDQVFRVWQAAKNAIQKSSGTPAAATGLQDAISRLDALLKAGCTHAITDRQRRYFEVITLFAKASVHGDLAFEQYELRKQHPHASAYSPQSAKSNADAAICCCREATRLLLSAELKLMIRVVFQTNFDQALASWFSEAALNTGFISGPAATIDYLREAVRLQPSNTRFRSNISAQLYQLEKASTARDVHRCREILEHIKIGLANGHHPSFMPALELFLGLPGLPDDLKKRAAAILATSRLPFAEEMQIYAAACAAVQPPGQIELRLQAANVLPLPDVLLTGRGGTAGGRLKGLQVVYRSVQRLSGDPAEAKRLIDLAGLAVACSLGAIALRASLRMESHKPLPDPTRSGHGPEWTVNEIHHNITVTYCNFTESATDLPPELEIWIAQTVVRGNGLGNQKWEASYQNLLAKFQEGFQGYGQCLLVGNPQPMGIRASEHGSDPERPVNRSPAVRTIHEKSMNSPGGLLDFLWLPFGAKAAVSRSRHYREVLQAVGGPAQCLTLVSSVAHGPNVILVYSWDATLSPEDADRLDTRIRAYLNEAVGIAARKAGLTVQSGSPTCSLLGISMIPVWLIGGRDQPTFAANSAFSPDLRRVQATIGVRFIDAHAFHGLHFDPIADQLAIQFQRRFQYIRV